MQPFEQAHLSQILNKAEQFTQSICEVKQFPLQKQAIKFRVSSGAELRAVLIGFQPFF